mmetsp:Transcript_50640/g.100047  ORF Transcript_50640/g.100047 Transcript_50640/m.100047 type:complete len:200 (-) Transcript_50640:154-753(-)
MSLFHAPNPRMGFSMPSGSEEAMPSTAGRCGRCLLNQRHSSPMTVSIAHATLGKANPIWFLNLVSLLATSNTAESAPSPAWTAARTASKASQRPHTLVRSSASKPCSSMCRQMLSRCEGGKSPPSSSSPSDSFCAASLFNTSDFLLMSRRISRTKSRERGSHVEPMFNTLDRSLSKWYKRSVISLRFKGAVTSAASTYS